MNVENKLNQWFRFETERYRRNRIPEIVFAMKQHMLSCQQLREVVSVRYEVAHYFILMLSHMLHVIETGTYREGSCKVSKVVKDALHFAVTENLKEENGDVPAYGGPHYKGRALLLSALGFNYENWSARLGTYGNLIRVDPSARYLVAEMKKTIELGAVEAVSALWYYEMRITLDYPILLSALEKKFPELLKDDGTYREGDALWHLASHARHDEHHAKLAEDALALLSGTPGMWGDSMEHGARRTLFAVDNFWNLLSEAFLGRFNAKNHWDTEVRATVRV
ncbi:MAG: hypothetical protein Q7R64_03610 [bacterium]|nr:hypothetical protein [bacterium]